MSKLATVSKQGQAIIDDPFEGMPTGLEHVTARDLLIPRLTILQGLSPQVTQGKPTYDPEAKVGDIYDVGMQERFPQGIKFVPVLFKTQWLEWAPRQSGKGLVKIHNDDAALRYEAQKDESGRNVLDNGNYIAETAQFFGINLTAGRRRSFLPMTSTQLKKARLLITWATSERQRLFSRAYKFTSVPESNNQGTWMGWKIERDTPVQKMPDFQSLVDEIKAFHASLIAGESKGDIADIAEEHGDAPL